MTAVGGAEVGRQHGAARRRSGRRRAGTWRCRPAGTGRSTASGRRRRTAGRAAARSRRRRRVGCAGRAGGEAHGDLELDRVGVLELVEQDAAGSARAGARRAPVVGGQQPAGQHQQVVELERAGGGPGARRRRARSARRSRRPRAWRYCRHAAQVARRPSSARAASLGAQRVERRPAALAFQLVLLPARAALAERSAASSLERQRGVVPRSRSPRASSSASAGELGEHARPGVSSLGRRRGARSARARATSSARRRAGPRRRRRARRGRSTRSQLAWKSSVTRRRPRGAAELAPAAQLHELGAAVRPGRDLALGIVEELVEEVLPPLVERELALELVEHGEARRQAGLDRELEQQAPGEGVQRADRGVVERRRGRPRRRPSAAPARRAARAGGGAARRRPSR